LLTLLGTSHLHQSAATAGSAMVAVGVFGGVIVRAGTSRCRCFARLAGRDRVDRGVDAMAPACSDDGSVRRIENVGITIRPLLGGLAWSLAGIQAASLTYAVATLIAAGIGMVVVERRALKPVTGRHSMVALDEERYGGHRNQTQAVARGLRK
jgi:hypothetical protein